MIFQIIGTSLAILLYEGTQATLTEFCETKAKAAVSLDLAIHLLKTIKENYQTEGRETNETTPKEVCNRPADCEDVQQNGGNKSGIYKVWPMNRIARGSVDVYCDMETDGGGWTVFQRRGDFGHPKDFFFQDWRAYRIGFGDIHKDFWLGNDNIFALSNQKLYSLRIDLRDIDGKRAFAVYDTFWIDDEEHQYTLHITAFSGDAGDSMIDGHNHNKQKFTTKDRKNDNMDGEVSCSDLYRGGWWYNSCHGANLNGLYHKGKHESYADGVNWAGFRGLHESLEWTEMKIRSKQSVGEK